MTRQQGRIVYADCFSGVSGDMLLAALCHAGVPEEVISDTVKDLGIDYKVQVLTDKVQGLACARLRVQQDGEVQERHLGEIYRLLESSALPVRVIQRAKKVFSVLAEAEARVHGCSAEEVHFHEVGAVDAIVDIVGVAVSLEYLGIEEVYCSSLPMSRGWVNCEHGQLPLPGPAVCELLRNVPVYGVDLEGELVTPTGAALVKSLVRGFGVMPPMSIERVGYGAGTLKRSDGRPNLLRLLVGSAIEAGGETGEIEVIETNIDDWHPEGIAFLSEKLMAEGALDVSMTPIHMKKNRPGILLRVLASPDKAFAFKQLILSESSSIGLRFRREQRLLLPRSPGRVATPWGEVGVKLVRHPSGARLHPEYESCRRLAIRENLALQDVYDAILRCSVDDFIAE
jgi:uncharacterized protein (TIGR00299 family) protein